MKIILLAARILLVVLFSSTGFLKLQDRAEFRQALGDFGVPVPFVPMAGVLVPLGELLVAALLAANRTTWWGAVGALGLLAIFSVAIAVSLVRGRRPACHCFGELDRNPVGAATLLRNGALGVVALLLIAAGPAAAGPGATAWVLALNPTEKLLLAMAAAALCLGSGSIWLLLQLRAQLDRPGTQPVAVGSMQSPWTLPIGCPAPGFALPDLSGQVRTLWALRAAGRPVLLVFAEPGCDHCRQLMPDIAAWQREYAGVLTVIMVSQGSAADHQELTAAFGLTDIVLQHDHELIHAYGVKATPSAVLVRMDGAFGSTVAAGSEAIRDLVVRVVGAPAPAAAQNAS